MSMTLSDFRARFSEFRQVSDIEIKNALADALVEMDTVNVWKDLSDLGQGFLAAHKLSITYTDPQDPNMRNYLKEYDRMKRTVAAGFRVA